MVRKSAAEAAAGLAKRGGILGGQARRIKRGYRAGVLQGRGEGAVRGAEKDKERGKALFVQDGKPLMTPKKKPPQRRGGGSAEERYGLVRLGGRHGGHKVGSKSKIC